MLGGMRQTNRINKVVSPFIWRAGVVAVWTNLNCCLMPVPRAFLPRREMGRLHWTSLLWTFLVIPDRVIGSFTCCKNGSKWLKSRNKLKNWLIIAYLHLNCLMTSPVTTRALLLRLPVNIRPPQLLRHPRTVALEPVTWKLYLPSVFSPPLLHQPNRACPPKALFTHAILMSVYSQFVERTHGGTWQNLYSRPNLIVMSLVPFCITF
mmetsp:Transcript_1635/g.2085  ORF Transcript_1635/g.2085 Transcript_1635/m.2085 type:complete len:207 (+) Transcript_1635:1761-2381(+)